MCAVAIEPRSWPLVLLKEPMFMGLTPWGPIPLLPGAGPFPFRHLSFTPSPPSIEARCFLDTKVIVHGESEHNKSLRPASVNKQAKTHCPRQRAIQMNGNDVRWGAAPACDLIAPGAVLAGAQAPGMAGGVNMNHGVSAALAVETVILVEASSNEQKHCPLRGQFSFDADPVGRVRHAETLGDGAGCDGIIGPTNDHHARERMIP